MKTTDYILIGIGIILIYIAYLLSSIKESTGYVQDYLFRGGTMYENQVIMIDKIFEMADGLDYIESRMDDIYYNLP